MMSVGSNVLANCTEPGQNSFNLVRLTAAILVVVSHSFLVPFGLGSKEPLQVLTSLTLGQHAVHVFFVISGLTLCRSVILDGNMARFARARLLRIVPALFGFGVFFAFIMGPLATSLALDDYFRNPSTWFYPFSVPVTFQQAVPPPEVFQDVPVRGAVNNPLWTIKYEVFAYLCFGIFASVGFLHDKRYSIGALVVAAITTIFLQPYQEANGLGAVFQAAKFSFCFLLGVVACLFQERLSTRAGWILATIAVTAILSDSRAALLAYVVLDAHVAILVGSINFGPLTQWTQQNDISYGTYIYGWPVQQFMVPLYPMLGLLGFAVAAVIGATMLGYVSWRLIERPALRLKHQVRIAGDKQQA